MVQSDLVEPHEKLIRSLGRLVKDHTTIGEHPLDLTLAEPLPSNVRFYIYNISDTEREYEDREEFAINVRFHNEHDVAKPKRSDDALVIVGGYKDEEDVFVFWDDDLYYDYGTNENPYTPYTFAEKHKAAVADGLSTRPRKHETRGQGGETVISARPDHVAEAIRMRHRLVRYRNILHDYLPEGWDDSPRQRQQLERVVDEFLTNTDLSKPTHERRRNAQEAVADAQDVNLSTIQEKSGSQLWEESPGPDGYQRAFFDSALDELEAEWRTGDDRLRMRTWTQPNPLFTDRDLPSTVDNLYFPQDSTEGPTVFEQITTALASGNHIILTGPPGAGKTELAQAASNLYVDDYELTTATNDWSTFDTIGGYHQSSDGVLEFQPGIVLKRFMNPDIPEPKNEWLIIDELNRADIDKAFGSLFSALTETTVTLPFENEDERPITLVGDPDETGHNPVATNRYYIPEDWRLLATINSADKASLYRMSYAFMRRFAFISVPVPTVNDLDPDNDSSILPEYTQRWGIEFPEADAVSNVSGDVENSMHEELEELWFAVQQVRPVGPGIIEDVLEHVLTQIARTGQLTYEHAFVAHILPQMDGQSEDDLSRVISQIDGRLPTDRFDDRVATRFAKEYLGVQIDG
jgi:energy-coupling factor transporter ATP-binding protein EcfA2